MRNTAIYTASKASISPLTAGVALDGFGNVFGATTDGASGFELSALTQPDGNWRYQLLYNFDVEGFGPEVDLVLDRAGISTAQLLARGNMLVRARSSSHQSGTFVEHPATSRCNRELSVYYFDSLALIHARLRPRVL